MSTDAALVFEQPIAANRRATDLRMALLLIPVAICLFSVVLAVEFPAFAAAVAILGAE
jgi:hypothetical protein